MHTESAANAEVVVVAMRREASAAPWPARSAREGHGSYSWPETSKLSTRVRKRSGAPEGTRSSVRLTSLTQARSSEPP